MLARFERIFATANMELKKFSMPLAKRRLMAQVCAQARLAALEM
jgi:hypothetical protein